MDKIIKIKVNENEKNFSYLGFITNDIQTIESLKTINYDYIKYEGVKVIKDQNNKEIDVYLISFTDVPPMLLEAIKDSINSDLNYFNTISCYDALKKIIDFFQKSKFKDKFEKRIKTDIGELIFLLKAKEYNLDFDKYLIKDDENNISFKKDKNVISLNNESKKTNKLNIHYKYDEKNMNIFYVTSIYSFEENQKNILSLFEKLNSSNPFVIDKYESYKWLFDDEENKKIFNKYTIDLNKIECFVIDKNIIPTIEIKSLGGLVDLKCKIKFSEKDKLELTYLKNFFDNDELEEKSVFEFKS